MGDSPTQQPLNWFAKHPVIASVLWMMGTDLNNNKNDSTGSLGSEETRINSSNRLSWKDDCGGNIAEFIGQVQTGDGGKANKEGTITSSALRKRGEFNNASGKDDRSPPNGFRKDPKFRDEIDVSAQSPQWGFYVSITPPQEQFLTQPPQGAIAQPLDSSSISRS